MGIESMAGTGSPALIIIAALLAALLAGSVTVNAVLVWRGRRTRQDLGSPAQRATYETLHTAWSAAPPLRAGLVPDAAKQAIRYLRELLGTPAVALTADGQLLAWEGDGAGHADSAVSAAEGTMESGRTQVVGPEHAGCADPGCVVRYAIVAPLLVDGRVAGALTAYAPESSAALVRATNEVARWVSGQLELAELDQSRQRMIEAEVRALRAQISPHFIYNSLTVIASFVRTDPEQARRLVLDFADFTRYSFRRHGDFTTLAEELRSIDQYLVLERARFGDRLRVTLRVAPEVLTVAVPFLCLQPLVENAIQHGLEGKAGLWHLGVSAEDRGTEACITVEDDGIGMEPDVARALLSGERVDGAGIALGNIDGRLRQVYGDEYGLELSTGVGAGTRITLRIPKYRPGVVAS